MLYYKGDGLTRYFVRSGEKVDQLIYKPYKNPNGDIAKNETYRGQLILYMGLNQTVKTKIENSQFNKKSLLDIFESYYLSKNTNYTSFIEKKTHILNLSIKPGLELAKIKTETPTWTNGLDLGLRPIFSIGVEAEYVLPVNNNKWALFIEPTFIWDKAEKFEYQSKNGKAYADYNLNLIRIPVGVRYYMFLSDYSRLFADFAVSMPLAIKSSLRYYTIATGNYENEQANLSFGKIQPGFLLGFGYNYKNLAAQFRYNGINTNLSGNNPSYTTKYNSFSLILAYKFNLSN